MYRWTGDSLGQEEKGDETEAENHDQSWSLQRGQGAAGLAQTHSEQLVLRKKRERGASNGGGGCK